MMRLIFGDMILIWYFIFLLAVLMEHTPVKKEGDAFIVISSLILGSLFMLVFIESTHLAGVVR